MLIGFGESVEEIAAVGFFIYGVGMRPFICELGLE